MNFFYYTLKIQLEPEKRKILKAKFKNDISKMRFLVMIIELIRNYMILDFENKHYT